MSNETLSWDVPVSFYGESYQIRNGYEVRLHASGTCITRITRGPLKFRKLDSVNAAQLCTNCTAKVVKESVSSAVVTLRNIIFVFKKAEFRSDVHTGLTEARNTTSIHPDFAELLGKVEQEATEWREALPVH